MQSPPGAGRAERLFPGIRRVLAPNPSAMTHWGTNSYIIGERQVAVIDPGPDDPDHLQTLLRAVDGTRVEFILITHAHRDHSGLARRLSARTGAPVLAFGRPEDGRSATMAQLAETGRAGGGEGVDGDFVPDRRLPDGAVLEVEGHRIEVVHTPGHFPGHLSFSVGDLLFSGDHVMGWSTTLISPPEGDVAAFLNSCERLLTRQHSTYLPGHGAPVQDPSHLVSALIRHRAERELQILDALSPGPANPAALAERIYREIPSHMLPVATRNVLAHLVDLTERGIVAPDPVLAWDAVYRRL